MGHLAFAGGGEKVRISLQTARPASMGAKDAHAAVSAYVTENATQTFRARER